MTRRLLFDQNLAPRLVDRVAADFPGSLHVRDLDLQAATDVEVLRAAAERDLVIVTKDKDFADIVTAHGDGPKVLWLMLGNVATDEIAESILVRRNQSDASWTIHRSRSSRWRAESSRSCDRGGLCGHTP